MKNPFKIIRQWIKELLKEHKDLIGQETDCPHYIPILLPFLPKVLKEPIDILKAIVLGVIEMVVIGGYNLYIFAHLR